MPTGFVTNVFQFLARVVAALCLEEGGMLVCEPNQVDDCVYAGFDTMGEGVACLYQPFDSHC